MLPANRDDRALRVHRTLDVDEDALLDTITAFALAQDLEVDRRHQGEGLIFRRSESSVAPDHLFRRGDALQVVITPDPRGHDVEFIADLSGSLRRESESRRGHVVRSFGLAGLFAFLGVRGLIVDVSFGDFILLGVGGLFSRRALRYANAAVDDADDLERKVANELNRVCDDAEFESDA